MKLVFLFSFHRKIPALPVRIKYHSVVCWGFITSSFSESDRLAAIDVLLTCFNRRTIVLVKCVFQSWA